MTTRLLNTLEHSLLLSLFNIVRIQLPLWLVFDEFYLQLAIPWLWKCVFCEVLDLKDVKSYRLTIQS